MITTSCPGCQRTLTLPDTFAGKQGKCNGCGHLISIPGVPPSAVPVGPAEALDLAEPEPFLLEEAAPPRPPSGRLAARQPSGRLKAPEPTEELAASDRLDDGGFPFSRTSWTVLAVTRHALAASRTNDRVLILGALMAMVLTVGIGALFAELQYFVFSSFGVADVPFPALIGSSRGPSDLAPWFFASLKWFAIWAIPAAIGMSIPLSALLGLVRMSFTVLQNGRARLEPFFDSLYRVPQVFLLCLGLFFSGYFVLNVMSMVFVFLATVAPGLMAELRERLWILEFAILIGYALGLIWAFGFAYFELAYNAKAGAIGAWINGIQVITGSTLLLTVVFWLPFALIQGAIVALVLFGIGQLSWDFTEGRRLFLTFSITLLEVSLLPRAMMIWSCFFLTLRKGASVEEVDEAAGPRGGPEPRQTRDGVKIQPR